MKTKQLPLIITLLLVLIACKPTEREQLNGKWKVSEIHIGKELIYSTDLKKQDQIIERVIDQQKAGLPQEAWGELEMMREIFKKKLKKSGETTITIQEDNRFSSSTYTADKLHTYEGTVIIDEQKKEITLKSDNTEKFSYSINGDKLTLTGNETGQTMKLEFRRL